MTKRRHSIQKGSLLQFHCLDCDTPIPFSLADSLDLLTCDQCGKQYSFADDTTSRQLSKFEALCRQLRESEEILGDTTVAIDVGTRSVKVPYKLLLTRLTSELTLKMNDQELVITFRIEPAKDLANA